MDELVVNDEELKAQRNKAEAVLKKTQEIIMGDEDTSNVNRLVYLEKSTLFYDMANQVFEKRKNLPAREKIPYFYEITSVMEAMMIALNVASAEDICYDTSEVQFYDVEWIKHLACKIKTHYLITLKKNEREK